MDQDTQRIQVVFSDCPTKWPEIITVEVTECFTYLGSGTYWFRCKHIGLGHVQAYQRLAATQMEPDYELQLYNAIVVSVLLYETRTLQSDEPKLEACHMTCQRRILGAHW